MDLEQENGPRLYIILARNYCRRWLVHQLSLKDTLDSLKLDIMGSLNYKERNIATLNMISSDDFVRNVGSTAGLDSLEGIIVKAKIYTEHEFLKQSVLK